MNTGLLAANATTAEGAGLAIWFLAGTVLVFFMQCGFAMVETGFTRAKMPEILS